MNRRAVIIAAAVVSIPLATLATACQQEHQQQPDSWVQGQTQQGPAVDPYSHNGVWSVPEQITPGTYAVQPNTDEVTSLRWWQMCQDDKCLHTIDGTTGYPAPSGGVIYINIPNDGTVKGFLNNGVKLTPAR